MCMTGDKEMLTTKNGAKNIGNALIHLADLLTDNDEEVAADEILENLTGQFISEEEAGEIKNYLST